MKLVIALTLVLASMVAAEPPVYQQASPDATPYQARGWRPSGRAFNLPQRQGTPSTVYGPPKEYGPPESEVTTTEIATETTTEPANFESQAENIAVPPRNNKLQSPKNEKSSQPQPGPGPVYVVVPQSQRLVYTAPLKLINAAYVETKKPEKLVAVREPNTAPVQAIPAVAKIQAPLPVVVENYEQYPQVVQFQQLQALPAATYASSLYQSSVLTPYSSSFIQIYQ